MKKESDLIIECDCSEEGTPISSSVHRESTEHGFSLISSDMGAYSYRTVVCGNITSFTYSTRSRLHALLCETVQHYIVGSVGHSVTHLLAVGLGNPLVTPDSLGSAFTEKVIADGEHIFSFTPLTKARTGFSTVSMVRRAAEESGADVIVAVDALTANEPHRLGTVIQISDRGISPGSGVSCAAEPICSETMPCPVIVIGVPTVIRSTAMGSDGYAPLLVTPSDIDVIIKAYSSLIAGAVNSVVPGNYRSCGIGRKNKS